jgi:hypothetical protein
MRATRMCVLCGVVIVAIAGSVYGKQSGRDLPDPNQPGPFSVGHTSFVLTDDARLTTLVQNAMFHKPRDAELAPRNDG